MISFYLNILRNFYLLVIKKKENRIGAHDIKLHRLQQHIIHVEKRKYVLDYKTKSLLERVEPLDQEIIKLKTNNQNIEEQLTILKQQQNNLISRENEYENKLNESSKQLNLAKLNHQHIWNIVKRQKGSRNSQTNIFQSFIFRSNQKSI
jgi:chromosome segregation ATPase